MIAIVRRLNRAVVLSAIRLSSNHTLEQHHLLDSGISVLTFPSNAKKVGWSQTGFWLAIPQWRTRSTQQQWWKKTEPAAKPSRVAGRQHLPPTYYRPALARLLSLIKTSVTHPTHAVFVLLTNFGSFCHLLAIFYQHQTEDDVEKP